MASASREDLEEIAKGKASARDRREAGVGSVAEAKARLSGHRTTGHVIHTRTTTPPKRKVRRRKKH